MAAVAPPASVSNQVSVSAADEESKIIELLEHKFKCIKFLDDKWIDDWSSSIERYFKLETRNPIRLKAIALLSQIFSKYHIINEDELMTKIILPNFNDVDQENDSVLRKPIVHLLFDIASACLSQNHCNAILAIVKKVLNKPFRQKSSAPQQQQPLPSSQPPQQQHQSTLSSASTLTNTITTTNATATQCSTSLQGSTDKVDATNGLVYIIGNVDIIDSRLIISNINKLFKTKLHRLPIDPAVTMLDILVNYLNLTYKCPLQDPTPAEIPMIRRELFSLFLKLRCNKYGHLGVLDTLTTTSSSISSSAPPSSNIQHQNQTQTTPSTSINNNQQQQRTQSQSSRGNNQTPNCNINSYNYNNNNNNSSDNKIEYSPFVICVKRVQKHLDPHQKPAQHHHHHHHHQGPMSPPSSPTTITNLNLFNQYPPQFLPPNQLHHQPQQQPNTILIQTTTEPNCPQIAKCINLDGMFSGIIECINQETDSDVLKLVLDGLPSLLANKLVTTTTEERINQLCLSLSDLIRNTKTCRQNSRVDIVKSGLRCLTTLLIYRKLLDFKTVKVMLSAFEDSLKVSHQQPIVPLFTTCLIELQESSEMIRFLPVVLHRLSKFSPTLNLGYSMLEFLSYLILFPRLYENFSEDEYKFIFAIALPYTNPFRFNDFITCLAFRVLAMWYLNCRPSLRCAFVELVKKSLKQNVIQPFKENNNLITNSSSSSSNNATSTIYSQHHHQQQQQSPNPITQTPPITYSSPVQMSPVDQRKRSSSLNTENSFRATQQTAMGIASQQLNEELMETFADLLSRYTHGQCLAIAPKNKSNDILIDRASSQTWLHGNSLVTITSGQSTPGWAEIMIRRPTGNTIWIGRLQNTLGTLPMWFNQQVYLDSLNFGNDVMSLFSAMSFADCSGNSELNLQSETTPLSSMSTQSINQSTQSLSTLSGLIGGSTGNTMANSINVTGSSSGSSGIGNSSSNGGGSSPQMPSPGVPGPPILLPKDKKFDIALANFDHITPYETHKIGVVYVAKGQVDSRAAILGNKCGSSKYYQFLGNIGTCITLNDIDPEVYFIGGLDAKGEDGKYAYFWKDNITQVIFHVATFMPLRESDPQCNNKNRHIGNDHICIVYNDSGQQFHLSTIKGTGQFLTASIVITPLEDNTNLIEVEVLPELKTIVGEIEPKVLTCEGVSLYARQMAIHLNLASIIHQRRKCEGFFNKEPYVSNWVERLRCIKRIRHRLEEYRKTAGMNNSVPIK